MSADTFTPKSLGNLSRFQRIARVLSILDEEGGKDKPRWTQKGGAFFKLAQLIADGDVVAEDLFRATDAYMARLLGPATGTAAAEVAEDDPRIMPEHPYGRIMHLIDTGVVKAKKN